VVVIDKFGILEVNENCIVDQKGKKVEVSKWQVSTVFALVSVWRLALEIWIIRDKWNELEVKPYQTEQWENSCLQKDGKLESCHHNERNSKYVSVELLSAVEWIGLFDFLILHAFKDV